jgi:hypothetical protein
LQGKQGHASQSPTSGRLAVSQTRILTRHPATDRSRPPRACGLLCMSFRPYLRRDSLREKIAAAGRAEVVEKHTYRHRMEQVLQRAEAMVARRVVAPDMPGVSSPRWGHIIEPGVLTPGLAFDERFGPLREQGRKATLFQISAQLYARILRLTRSCGRDRCPGSIPLCS